MRGTGKTETNLSASNAETDMPACDCMSARANMFGNNPVCNNTNSDNTGSDNTDSNNSACNNTGSDNTGSDNTNSDNTGSNSTTLIPPQHILNNHASLNSGAF